MLSEPLIVIRMPAEAVSAKVGYPLIVGKGMGFECGVIHKQ